MAKIKIHKHTSITKPTTRKIQTKSGAKVVMVRGHLNRIGRKK